MKDDPNKIARIEKAIADKYGKETIENPKKFWTNEKERKHIEQTKKFYEKIEKNACKEEMTKHKGMLVSKKLLNKVSNRKFPVCYKYSFERKDNLYMNKFQCCFDCYIQYVEGREERWDTGWRPEID